MTRPLLRAAALIIAGLLDGTTEVRAAGEQQELQAPGHYRMRLGAFEITALSDGTIPAGASVNGYLINTGKQLLLIDTGAGTLLGPGLGKLVDNLRAAGFQPEQINEIYITDMHPADIGGLLSQRKAVFPNALVRAFRPEAQHWLAKSSMAAAPIEERQQFAQVAASLKPYIAAGRLQTFDDEVELAPGIRALPGAGHLLGQTSYAAQSGREKIVFCGEAERWGANQVQAALLVTRFDEDPATAVAGRTALFKDIATHGYWVAGANLPFPGIGHLRANGHGFKFVPISSP